MIEQVRLKNFRRYVDATFQFGPGANFVEGENNAGKTSVLYAIEYALFGRVDGYKSQLGLMHPGARGVGVELVFDGKDGARYRLQRAHLLPPRSKTKLAGHFTLKRLGADDVPDTYVLSSDFDDHEDALAQLLSGLLGLTRRSFALAVHMKQGEIARILEGSSELDVVLGVTAAVMASDELRGLALEFEKEAAALPVLEESLRRQGEERARLAETAKSAEGERAAVEAELARLAGVLGAVEGTEKARKSLESAHEELLAAHEAHHDLARRRDDHAERLGNALVKGSLQDVEQRIVEAEGKANGLANERAGVERLRAERAAARSELDQRRGDLVGRIGRRQALPTGADARCEACGATVDEAHNATEIAGWQAELATLDAALVTASAALDEVLGAGRAIDAQDKDLSVALAADRTFAEELRGLVTEDATRRAAVERAAAELVARAAKARAAVDAWSGDPLNVPGTAEDVAGARLLTRVLGDALRDLARVLGERRVRAEAEQTAAIARRERLDADLSGLAARLADVERELAGTDARLVDLRKKGARAGKLRDLSAAFKDLQGALRTRASEALATDAQALHAQLSAGDDRPPEFDRITVDPQRYSVQVVPKHLGEEVPAALYEGGGHRLLLGLAFKLAVARLRGRVPFVLMDEPTYGLDDRHRANLLDRIAALGAADQIVLITHETMGKAGGKRLRVTRHGGESRVEAL